MHLLLSRMHPASSATHIKRNLSILNSFDEYSLEISQKLTLLNDSLPSPNTRVIFSHVNEKSSVICRSFSSSSSLNNSNTYDRYSYDHITTSIQGFRIVQFPGGTRAEFMINMLINGSTFKVWKKYSQFQDFATILFENFAVDAEGGSHYEHPLYDSWKSWNAIISHKSWFRDLSIIYLIRKTLRLENFLRHTLFGLDSVHPLLDFLVDQNQENTSSCWWGCVS